MPRLNPKIDLTFKKIFGVEENKDLLISLINSILSEEDQVVDITLLNPYNPKNFKNDKLSLLDIEARGLDGKLFNIEIQITDEASYDKAALYYWAKLYTGRLKALESYHSLSKAIGIHILNFISINNERYHNCFHIREDETGERYFPDLELHTIELKKFRGEGSTTVTDLLSRVASGLDMWVALLARHDLLTSSNLAGILNRAELTKALHVMDAMQLSDDERDIYESRLKWLRAETGAIETAEARGKEKGREEGISIGIERTALNMLREQLSVSVIASVTGLSPEEIEALKAKL